MDNLDILYTCTLFPVFPGSEESKLIDKALFLNWTIVDLYENETFTLVPPIHFECAKDGQQLGEILIIEG